MRVFHVDSRTCVGTASSFQYGLTRGLNVPENGRFRVDNLRVPLTFNLVNQNNQNLYYLDGTTYRQAVIARGNYDSNGLAAALQAAFTAAGGSPVAVAFNGTTGATTFTVTTSGTWTLLSDAQLLALAARYPSVTVANPKSFNAVLGWPSTAVSVVSNVWTFPFVSVLPYDTLFLCSSRLTGANSQAPWGSAAVVCQIPITGTFGDVEVGASPLLVWNDVGPLSADSLDFQLTDRFGNPVNILAGNMSFQLTVDTSLD